jgi:hypothetical protein
MDNRFDIHRNLMSDSQNFDTSSLCSVDFIIDTTCSSQIKYLDPTCFGAVTPSSGSALLVLAEVTVVKLAN